MYVPQDDERHPTEPSRSLRWLEAYADHVRKRFTSRAIVSARLAGEAPVVLSHVYALESGGLVLVVGADGSDHESADHGHHGHEHGEASAHHPHTHTAECGCQELWIESPEDVIFEARHAEDGALCTGFGYLGASRTPRVLVPRGTEPPPRRDHDHGDF